jgi:hypothetical protein
MPALGGPTGGALGPGGVPALRTRPFAKDIVSYYMSKGGNQGAVDDYFANVNPDNMGQLQTDAENFYKSQGGNQAGIDSYYGVNPSMREGTQPPPAAPQNPSPFFNGIERRSPRRSRMPRFAKGGPVGGRGAIESLDEGPPQRPNAGAARTSTAGYKKRIKQ